MGDGQWLTILALAVEWLIRVGFAIHILMRRRPLGVTMGWIALVLLLPVLGILIYVLFGEIRVGADRMIWRKRFDSRLLDRASVTWAERAYVRAPRDALLRQVAAAATAAGRIPPLEDNELELLTDWRGYLDVLREEVERAQTSVFVQNYIWYPSEKSDRLAAALLEAAQRGVDCRLLLDGVGSYRFLRSAWRRRLEGAGVRVVGSLPLGFPGVLFRRLDVRNHRKVAIFDGAVAYVGSQNVNDETFGIRDHRGVGPWIDANVRVRGPLVQALQMVFLRDWEFDAGERTEALDAHLPPVAELPGGGTLVQLVPSGPGSEAPIFQHGVLSAIYSAKREIRLSTPYFVPDEPIFTALTAAARRGVGLHVIVPHHSDSLTARAAARGFYPDLLAAGAIVHEYMPAMLHTKAMTIDDDMAIIGSANLDVRSFFLNYECMLFVYDQEFTHSLYELLGRYIAESSRIDAEDWASLPFGHALVYSVANLARQLL